MTYTCKHCLTKESLPFRCSFCNNYFCRKHYPYDKHLCTKSNTSYKYISESRLEEINLCQFEGCVFNDVNSYICDKCNKKFCSKHKYPWHNCKVTKSKKGILSWFKSCLKGN